MDQTTKVINALDDAINKNVDYKNRMWLRQNVEKLGIQVCIEDAVVNVFDIAENWNQPGRLVIQNGNPINFKGDFNPLKEAILIYHSYAYRYSPQDI